MLRKTKWTLSFLFILIKIASGQELVTINGGVLANDNVEGIHILNKTSKTYSITDESGQFQIKAKKNDTLIVSAVQYLTKEIFIDSRIIDSRQLLIELEENVNMLDEVVVGKILTGNLDLDLDLENTKRDINFYDVGIPGYTGPKKTQTQRRIYEATSGSGLIPLNPILNFITGRTKELKERAQRELKNRLMEQTKDKYAKMIFTEVDAPEIINQFFQYVSEDTEFLVMYYKKNDLVFLKYLMDLKAEFMDRQVEDVKD